MHKMTDLKKEPERVFTPRNPSVNPEMYIGRPPLERALTRALKGSLHIVIHGESGSGKSWLYKKVLSDLGVYFEVLNFATAVRSKSIHAALEFQVSRQHQPHPTGLTQKKGSKVGISGTGTERESTTIFTIGSKEPLEACFEAMHVNGAGKQLCLVFDNLELIFGETNLMDELGSLITVIDDPQYAAYGVRILIVGVPSEVKEYFARVPSRTTIANRLYEIPEVGRLDRSSIRLFVERGFVQQLGAPLSKLALDSLAEHVHVVTDGLPQFVHEYCLEFTYVAAENSWDIDDKVYDVADVRWIKKSFSAAYPVVERWIEGQGGLQGVKQEVLYAISRLDSDTFTTGDAYGLINQFFGKSALKMRTVAKTLRTMTTSESPSPVLTAMTTSHVFRFVDPRYRRCLRLLLKKTGVGRDVVKVGPSVLG